MFTKLKTVSIVALTSLASTSAMAAIDTTKATDAITDGVTALGLIGAGFLVFVIVKKIWARLG